MATSLNNASNPRRGVDAQASCTATDADTLRIVADMDLTVTGIPAVDADGNLPTAVAVVDARTFDLSYEAGTFTAGADVNIPQFDGRVRTQTGGYLRPGTFPVDAP